MMKSSPRSDQSSPTECQLFVGSDVSKKTLDVAILDLFGKIVCRRFANDLSGFQELVEWCLKYADGRLIHFCMESTGSYSFGLACYLADLGLLVSVENPRFIKSYGIALKIQNKTDKADAKVIARYCQAMRPKRWSLTDPALRELDMLLKRLSDLEGLRLQEANRLENQWLPESSRDSLLRTVLEMEKEHERILIFLESRLAEMPQILAMVRALCHEPGVGELTALRMLSHMDWQAGTYRSAQEAAAAAGLNPVKRESGKWKGKTKISKAGPARFRGELHMAAVAAITFNPRIKLFYQRLLSKGMPKLAAVTACARKLVMICYGILKAFARGDTPEYGAVKIRFTNLRGKQRLLNPQMRPKPLTI